MLENRQKTEDQIVTRKFSLKFKLVALLLIFAFVFQSMDTINWHTYNIKGVSIHSHDCTTPAHLSYFCGKTYTIIF